MQRGREFKGRHKRSATRPDPHRSQCSRKTYLWGAQVYVVSTAAEDDLPLFVNRAIDRASAVHTLLYGTKLRALFCHASLGALVLPSMRA